MTTAPAPASTTASTTAPPYGLLLDVDGPIASPLTRTIAQPSIVPDLLALVAAGVPVVFNTGRSDAFLAAQVLPPLRAAGIPAGARIHAVCEKGAVWFTVHPDGETELVVDEALAVPAGYGRMIEDLVAERYADTMFFDATKRAMVSVEQHVGVDSADYLRAQAAFDADALAGFAAFGLGARLGEREVPDAAGQVQYRVDPTIISTDVESVVLGKDFGAARALELLAADGEAPRAWFTVGDSRTDYAMADWLHAQGHEVSHVDVRPADGQLERPYPVLTEPGLVNDEAGAAFLARLVAELGS